MTHACVPRTANLLGAFALAASERIDARSDTAAIVSLLTTLDGESQETLRRALGLTQTAVVRLIDRLADERLVERRPGPDGRTRAIAVTADGRTAALAAQDRRATAMQTLLGALEDDERRQFAALLEKLLAGITHGRDDARHICRLCDPDSCGHHEGRCPVTRAADAVER
jgi:MarR family transcriptional regulator, negative regulator of the multidrug operon emrRAB